MCIHKLKLSFQNALVWQCAVKSLGDLLMIFTLDMDRVEFLSSECMHKSAGLQSVW